MLRLAALSMLNGTLNRLASNRNLIMRKQDRQLSFWTQAPRGNKDNCEPRLRLASLTESQVLRIFHSTYQLQHPELDASKSFSQFLGCSRQHLSNCMSDDAGGFLGLVGWYKLRFIDPALFDLFTNFLKEKSARGEPI